MCKICMTEPGDITMIDEHTTEMVVKGEVRGRESLEVKLHVNDSDTPEYYLISEFTIFQKHPTTYVDVAEVVLPIKYCPFCGRKLHNY